MRKQHHQYSTFVNYDILLWIAIAVLIAFPTVGAAMALWVDYKDRKNL